MTYPTRALIPVMLEDYRRIMVNRRGETQFYSSDDIDACMSKVTCVQLHQTLKLDGGIEVTAYYAGHVLGAVMFRIQVGSESVVYTGDFSVSAERHLAPAWIDAVRPDVLITESTYGATTRASKSRKEADLLHKIHSCVSAGGKVLVPVFAVGRAQELCLLLDAYWERMGLTKVPIYFSTGLAEAAGKYYRLFLDWTSEHIRKTAASSASRNVFDYKHITGFDTYVCGRCRLCCFRLCLTWWFCCWCCCWSVLPCILPENSSIAPVRWLCSPRLEC